MPRRKLVNLPDVVTYPRDAVLERAHVALALHVNEDIVEAMDLPQFPAGARPRYVWGQVLDELQRRADPHYDERRREAQGTAGARRVG